MRARIFLLLLFTCLFPAFSFATIFTVTSNADSGPGTLRDALTLAAANGNAEKDYIYFNMPGNSITDRTITLISQLPPLTSNIVIDGSTQPGDKFGDSNARIRISTPVTNDTFITFRIMNVKDVELYGLYLLDYTHVNAIWPDVGQRACLQIEDSENIVLGASGKGNLIKGFHDFSILAKRINGIRMQDNIVGLNENNDFDHPPYANPAPTAGISLIDCDDLMLGGDAAQEGNTLFCTVDVGYNDKSKVHTIDVKSNNMGVFKDGKTTSTYFQDEFLIQIYTIGINSSGASPEELNKAVTLNLTIKNNVAGNFGRAIYINGIKGSVLFTRNYLGVARDGVTSINHGNSRPNEGAGFNIDNTLAIVTIGGMNTSDKNYFFDHRTGVGTQNSPNVFIRNNEYRCMTFGAFGTSDVENLPQIKITKWTAAGTSAQAEGIATPNAIIDIYGSMSCDFADCSIGSKIATVIADTRGNWSARVSLSGTIYASATLNNQTSPFKTLEVTTTNIIVENIRCTNRGSITGATVPEGAAYYWVNEQGELVSHDLNFTTSTPGKYKLLLNECNGSPFYEIKDNRLSVYDYQKVITNASCGMTTGSIKGIFYNDPLNMVNRTIWKNGMGNIVSSQIDAINLPAGSYLLTINTTDGCEKIYGPIIITNTNGPSINQSAKTITSSPCAASTGAITGITGTGTNVKYSWKNEQQQEVGTNADLTNQPPGKYTLTITDDSQCGPVTTQPIEIPAVNDVSINTTNKVVQNATCSNADGSITGIEVAGSGTLTYTWTNEFGQIAATTKQLPAAVAGNYTLTVTGGNCTPVVSQPIEIFSVGGVTIDKNNISGQAATSCNTGFIKGITSPNATSASWKRLANGAIVSTTFDLLNAVAGNYELTLANATCTNTFPFTIDQLPATIFPDFPATYTKSCFAFGTGTISLNTDNTASQPSEYIWRNARGERVGYDKKVEFLPAGKYQLYLRDITGCESFYKEYTVDTYPEFSVGFGSYDNIYCGVGKGKINGAIVTGGTGNYVYEWFDGDGNLISGQTQPSLTNLEPGNYKLRITDGGCGLAELTYPIIATTQDINAPVADDLKLCATGTGVISIKDPYPTALYRLYDGPASALPLSEQIGGKFNVTITESRSYFISLVYGNCESDRTEVKVAVGSIAGTIPNTFTPNGDGVNDYWALKGFENYPNGTVRIFNRSGQMVFQSTGYPKPFDGTWRGAALPAGSYYYIIDLKSCNIISGSVTIIR